MTKGSGEWSGSRFQRSGDSFGGRQEARGRTTDFRPGGWAKPCAADEMRVSRQGTLRRGSGDDAQADNVRVRGRVVPVRVGASPSGRGGRPG